MKRYILAAIALFLSLGAFGQRNWQFSFNSIDSFVEVSPDYVSGAGGVIDVTVGLTSQHYESLTENLADILLANVFSSGIVVDNVRSAGWDGDYLLFSASMSIPALPVGTMSGSVSFKGSADYSYHVVTQGGATLQGVVSATDHEDMLPGQYFDIVVTGADNTQSYTLYRYVNGEYDSLQCKNPVNGRIVYHLSGPGIYLVGVNAEVFCDGTVVAYESEIFSDHYFRLPEGGHVITLSPSGSAGSLFFESTTPIDTSVFEFYLGLLQTEMPGLWSTGLRVEVGAYSNNHKRVRLDYKCCPNYSDQTRLWDTGFRFGTQTIYFIQNGGGTLKTFVFSSKANEGRTSLSAVSNGSQPGVLYSLRRNGSDIETKEGTGYGIQIPCPDTTGVYTVRAYYSDNDISLSKDMIGEISMPVYLPPVINEGPQENNNWRRSYTLIDEDGQYYVDAIYYNGLGYPDQEVMGFSSGDGRKHIYKPIAYDNMLNPNTDVLLPYVKNGVPLTKDDTSNISQAAYYASAYGIPESNTARSISMVEPTTRQRIIRSRQPGRKYSDMDKWIRHTYRMNKENEIRKGSDAYYPQASLFAHTTTDEDGRSITEFKDVGDNIRTIRYYDRPADTTSYYDVNYAYDLLGRLKSVSTGYYFLYDEYGRLVQKDGAGVGNETYLYDDEDRLVYKAQTKAHYLYEYDDYGRLIRTYAKPERWSGYDTLHDSLIVIPSPLSFDGELLCETYWGTYPSSAMSFTPVLGLVDSLDISSKTRGRKTFERQAIIPDDSQQGGDVAYVERTYYYDDRERVLQIIEKTPLGTTLRTSFRYDYVGNPIRVLEEHIRATDIDRSLTSCLYDARGRETFRSISYNDEIMATIATSYDDLGRVSAIQTDLSDLSTTEVRDYTLQGRLKETSGDYLNQRLYYEDEIPDYELPVQYGGNIANYVWDHGTGTDRHFYSYCYDGRNRLFLADRYDYEILETAESLQYNELSRIMSLSRYDDGNDCIDDLTFSLTGIRCPTYVNVRDDMDEYTRYDFAYDNRGNQTEDQLDGLTIAYNVMDKPSRISTSSGKVSYYTYLADGTKTGLHCNDGSGYEYIGPFRYRLQEGDLVLDEIPFPGGRIRKDEDGNMTADYYALDYLGSVRTIVNESGDTQVFDYFPYGTLWPGGDGAILEGNQTLFNGKEMQILAGTNLYDYGARFYNPRTGMWLTRDPLADDYKEYSPYVFCAGNPVNVVDPDGESTYVRMISPECYRVIDGGDPEDGDDNIYVVYYDANGAAHPDYSIGTTATPYSFYDSSESGWKAIHAYIDLTDESAFRFTDYFVDNDISLFDYIRKARNYGLFDFKETNFDENEVGIHHSQLHQYRGMPISRGGKPIIASARDVGNIVAGYMSAVNHIPYFLHRLACDYYQSISGNKGGWTVVGPITHDMTFKWDFEGPESTVAQRLGWEIGRNKKRK